MLKRGMRWRVGDGEKIKVLKDAWIPGSQSPESALSVPDGGYLDLEVGALIDLITRSWNEVLLSQLFLPYEDRILSIPLSHKLPEDMLCWDLEKAGIYLVKWAFHAIANDAWSMREESTSSVNQLGNMIWSADVFPRFKIFAWRACLEALPTRLGLSRRMQHLLSECGICGAAAELGMHALFSCVG